MQLLKQGFNKEERLKSNKLIEKLFETGKVVNHYPFKARYNFPENSTFKFPAKVAISVSKKNFKSAADRNYIKRKIREAYRKNKHNLYEKLTKNDQKIYFIVIYIATENIDYKIIEENLKSLINKITNKIEVRYVQ